MREMAYEHWHRMLFARFLAENQLLIEPSSGVSISLDECEELAAEEGTDLWGLAAQFAQAMLPQIFRTDDPVLAAKLPLENRQQLQGLVAGLETETFTASDSLGWTYQFWQTKRKKEVNDSSVKIGADELSPVTQLFTEDYMVDFLLDNTLGAWHAGKMLAANSELASTAQTEDDLRQAVALPDCPWSYLRFVKSDDGTWSPAAGTFEGWPRAAAELKCLDPCMGSGHFVVAMFERLVALRLAEGEQMEAAAVAAVIAGNLFGLEIDPRCTQIAAFNLALAAWRRLGYCKLPAMNLACSGLAPNTQEADWLAMAGDNERLRNGMERLYRLFQKASVLGSLINPRAAEGDLLVAAFHELQPLLEQALAQENQDDTAYEMAVTARGVAKAAEILANQFTLVATNVPYVGQIWQTDSLRSWCVTNHENAKTDLAFVFLRRLIALARPAGAVSLVMPQGWLFQTSEKDFRKWMLSQSRLELLARVGRDAFEISIGADVLLGVFSGNESSSSDCFSALDACQDKGPMQKAKQIKNQQPILLNQLQQLKNRQHCIVLSDESSRPSAFLGDYAETIRGLSTGESKRFYKLFWELDQLGESWEPARETTDRVRDFGGMSYVILWENERGSLYRLAESLKHLNHAVQSWQRGRPYWGRTGVAINRMASLAATRYLGEKFTENVGIIAPKDESYLPAIYAFCASDEFKTSVSLVNPKLDVEPRYLANLPFDLSRWQRVADQKYPNGLPKPYSSDPTQWLFNGHPAGADQPLQVAVARLLGYQWPRQTGSSFLDCPALGPDGLEGLADADGIVCISPIRGEAAAADRLRGLLSAAFGREWSSAKERELLLETAIANNAKKPAADLGDWLRLNFFAEHCKLFQSRPFIWQVWDGNPQGFSALVNYHKLAAPKGQGRKTLELLTYTYLGDWIDRQKLDQADGVNGADDRLAAALDLQGQLKIILDGEPPYDLFVRWKPLHQQAIGWEPDINDGVRLNIRPFLNAEVRKGGKADAGILRAKPGAIKWTKDRGKEIFGSKDEFPWLWGWNENTPAISTDFGAQIPGAPPAGDSLDGNRWNDLHYTRAAKEAARARHRGEG
jgi:hypothetical protein